jgi:hypothetical protein
MADTNPCRLITLFSIACFAFSSFLCKTVMPGDRKIKIQMAEYTIEAEIYDNPTGRAIYQALPIESQVKKWGGEIYFEIPVQIFLDRRSTAKVMVGDLAYWPNGPAFCIFYGPTPASTDKSPKAADAVNVFGRVIDIDIPALKNVQPETVVRVVKRE